MDEIRKDEKRNQIEEVISSAMSSLRDIVDVNTVIGKPITTENGKLVIPISKVTLGFLAGGGEYSGGNNLDAQLSPNFPFAGGSGAYVQMTPLGFLTDDKEDVKTVVLDNTENTPYDKIVSAIGDYVKGAISK